MRGTQLSTTRSALAVMTAVALATSGCAAAHRAGPPGHVPQIHPEPTPPSGHVSLVHSTQGRPVPHLEPYSDCDQLLQSLRAQGLREVTDQGLAWNQGPMKMIGVAPDALAAQAYGTSTGAVAGAAEGTAAAAPSAGTGADFSGTNNQEAGVDEPDVVKTDGHLLVVVRRQTQSLEVYRVDGSSPHLVSSLSLQHVVQGPQLFLTGSSVVALGTRWYDGVAAYRQPTTVAAVISLDDPAQPRVVRTFRVTGSEIDARYVGGRVELVVQSAPNLPLRYPASDAMKATALRDNRLAVERAPLAAWLPTVTTTPSTPSRANNCTATWHTVGADDPALSSVSVVSFDPGDEQSVRQTTILGSATTVYASTDALYLATGAGYNGGPVPVGMAVDGTFAGGGVALPAGPIATAYNDTTRIHQFDISNPAAPRYVGSGVVQGTLVDQYSMGEYDGYLRVATTVGFADPAPNEGAAPKVKSDNRVTVLHAVDGALVQAGQVRGLGRGEKIYGVRFVGPLGYVVTFRQIDPLYILDLADPRHPRALGHLKVTGYSAYLHPLGDGLLLGLGREVDANAHPIGEQLSVFDVTDPADPHLLSRLRSVNTFSPAESDHHAFLWWPKDRLVVVPMSSYDGSGQLFDVVYQVSAQGALSRVGSLRQPAAPGGYVYGTMRSTVIGGLLYTVTDAGVMANDLHSLARVAWLPFR